MPSINALSWIILFHLCKNPIEKALYFIERILQHNRRPNCPSSSELILCKFGSPQSRGDVDCLASSTVDQAANIPKKYIYILQHNNNWGIQGWNSLVSGNWESQDSNSGNLFPNTLLLSTISIYMLYFIIIILVVFFFLIFIEKPWESEPKFLLQYLANKYSF